MSYKPRRATRFSPAAIGFTLIELLVVIAIIAILAGLIMPALSKAKLKAHGIACINNNKQLVLAWILYADDNGDGICPTGGTASATNPNNWVLGTSAGMSLDDTAHIKNGLLFRYSKNVKLYKDPGDTKSPHSRSMSMNGWMNPDDTEGGRVGVGGRLFKKMTDITRPSMIWVTIDENPFTINDGWFVVTIGSATWTDCPATYHIHAGGLSFADAHAQIKKWRDTNVLSWVSGPGVPVDNSVNDWQWLQSVTTIK